MRGRRRPGIVWMFGWRDVNGVAEAPPDGRSGDRMRPADICRALLAALDASDGRRRRRKRDQTPDAFGLAVKRRLLEGAVRDDPSPADFEGWLLDFPRTCAEPGAAGAALAMARAVFEEWTLAQSLGEFRMWLEHGAPSEDAAPRGPDRN